MGLTLYGIGASRAVRPLWAALELGVPFDHVAIPYAGGATRTPDFLAINPNGHIPALVDTRPEGAVTVWESMACTLYLVSQYGSPGGEGIAPANAHEEADALRWSFWAVTEIEKNALTVLMHRLGLPEAQRQPALAEEAEQALRGPLAVLEQHLQQQQRMGRNYLAANRFTVADLCVASVLGWARPAPDLLSHFPAVDAWLNTCIQRPAHKQARAMK